MIKCIIFDLDGTLLDTLIDIRDSINESLISFSYEGKYELSHIRSFIGSGVNTLLKRAMDGVNVKECDRENIINKYKTIYKEKRIDNTIPYQGVKETLLKLKKENIFLAVLSNKPDIDTKACISHFFDDIFDVVLGERKGYKIKPDPNGIFEIMKMFNVNKEETLFVGDMLSDKETSSNASTKFLACLYGYAPSGVFDNETYKIHTFNEILNVIKEINNGN